MDISAYICILKHSSNVVAQLTRMYRQVGCRPVRLSPSRLSLSWFVAQMTVHLCCSVRVCVYICCSSELWCTTLSDAAICLCRANTATGTGFVFGGLVNGSLLVIEVRRYSPQTSVR